MTESATYDIAVSFAEHQRTVVDEVVEACRQRGLTVLESNDLPEAEVRFLVPFVSTADEVWTTDEHVLPVLTDEDHASPEFLRANEHLVDTLVSRVEEAETAGRDRAPVADLVAALKQPEPVRQEPAEAEQVQAEQVQAEQVQAEQVQAESVQAGPAQNPLRALAEQFAAASPAFAKRALAGTVHMGDTTVAVRVERKDNTVYAVELHDDETVNFVVLGGSPDQFSTLWQRIEGMLTA